MTGEASARRPSQSGPTDEELVLRARGGNPAAFGELSDRYRRPLFNAAYKIVGSKEDAQDVAQDALVKAFTRLENFDVERRFFSWIYRIAVNEALDRAARLARESDGEADFALEVTVAPDSTGEKTVYRRLEEAEVSAQLHNAIQRLQPSDRVLIVLHYLAEMPYTEVSATLQLPVEKVRSRLFSARQRLRIVLESDQD